ncbi:MAG: 5-(carboxyamino)imidazole ribonucleotide mutase [Pseudomonadota bacterium]
MATSVAVVMGSRSDWETMKSACDILDDLEVPYHCEVVSAHRTPEKMHQFAKQAKANGFKIIIAGAGGAAHLPGMIAASTPLPVLGVPIQSKALNGLDSLLSIVQMPKGVAVGTLAIGTSGAINAGLLACQILAINDNSLANRVDDWRERARNQVEEHSDPRLPA